MKKIMFTDDLTRAVLEERKKDDDAPHNGRPEG